MFKSMSTRTLTKYSINIAKQRTAYRMNPKRELNTDLGFSLSHGVLTTLSPPIPEAYKWATEYKATPDRPLLDMSQGVPGLPPPKAVIAALADASSSPRSFGYCPAAGESEMRGALAEEMKNVYGEGCTVSSEDIALTAGCNLAFVAAVMSVADAGDEIILPMPWYFNHRMALNLLNLRAIPLELSWNDDFLPSVEYCAGCITSRTKAIVLVTPNNPTGAIYSPKLLLSFFELAKAHKIALIIDETYRDFITSGPPHNLFDLADWRTTFIHLFSFSKSYCLPGHRLGAVVASPQFIQQLLTVLDTLQICPPRPVQQALAPLLASLRPHLKETAGQLEKRHNLFAEHLPSKWKIASQGGYYAYVRHPFIAKGTSQGTSVPAADVCKRLAKEMGVVTLPCSFFRPKDYSSSHNDWDCWIRFSVANVNDEKIEKVCQRLVESESAFGWEVASV